ncbi:hypothetical protein PsYK624_151290 [Phanerochaete sordida]|uniref:Transmembrane protein n=1 Tax=Phanerochaete sordida TaxID=48140 RepID=A0A9P3LM17_9APHY|nr:hypothetical protein PsYK624_151290 [Phanerochaete sordida]
MVADGWWIYYYVQSNVDPIPSHVVGKSAEAINAFAGMMFIFGFFWSLVHAFVGRAYREADPDDVCCADRDTVLGVLGRILAWSVILFLIIMPFFGGWIVERSVHSHVWSHRCDSFPAFVILDANPPKNTTAVNVAQFFINQPSSSKPTQLFTYEIASTDNGSNWRFSLQSWQTPQESIPLPFYPTLQSIHYDLGNQTMNGNCTLSTVANATHDAVGNTTVVPCMSGTFDSGAHLFFNITSAVPLNNTLSTSYPAATPNVTALLAIPGNGWAFKGHQPALQLQEEQPSGSLGNIVLRTATTKLSDKTQLKVCVAGPLDRQGATVQPEVLGPIGLILLSQANYAGVLSQLVDFEPDMADIDGGEEGERARGGRGG